MPKIKVAILGSTGSIGSQALEVVRENPEQFEIVALASGGSSNDSKQLFSYQVAEFLAPNFHKSEIADRIALSAIDGQNAVVRLADRNATGADIVLNGIAGNIGLEASLKAMHSGAKLALANKESLVVGGTLFRDFAKSDSLTRSSLCDQPNCAQNSALNSAKTNQLNLPDLFNIISPVDSEHSAIWQVYKRKEHAKIDKLILTASGGPFRGLKTTDLIGITPQQALNHPTWQMGELVTINSATLMNKALELVEAVYLFGVKPNQVEVTVHPQSIVHSGLQYADGATLLQASPPSMKLPIALAINSLNPLPEHLPNTVSKALNWQESLQLDFEPVDNETFPAISLACDLLERSPLYLAAMNIFNERAVYEFLGGELQFNQIITEVRRQLETFNPATYAADPNRPTAEELLNLLQVL